MKPWLLLIGGCCLALFAALGWSAPLPEKFQDPNIVTIDTNHGLIRVRLLPDKAPLTVANFLRYVDDGFYKDLIFHRVIPNFVIQGGGFDAQMAEKRGRAPVRNEASNGLKNQRGTLAMARTVDPDSGTSQFYINLKDHPVLDGTQERPGYCVFGQVIEGMDVVDRIAQVPTGQKGVLSDVPQQPILIRAIRRGRN
jgi:cyclophilin family peptidyl-prolyl cis-trans isomerase